MPELAQHVVVTLAALSAAGIIVRRVFGAVVSRGPSSSPCASCPSAAKHGKTVPAASSESSAKPAAEPMILLRRGTRDA